jgi:autotransporter-associated beta strand protein
MTLKLTKVRLSAAAIASLTLTAAQAVEIVKAPNPDSLELASSWVGGVQVPGVADIAVFDASFSSGGVNVGLNASIAFQGLRVTGNTQNITLAPTGSVTTLTLGTAGLDLANATAGSKFTVQAATLAVPAATASQWSVGNSVTLHHQGNLTVNAGSLLKVNLGAGAMFLADALAGNQPFLLGNDLASVITENVVDEFGNPVLDEFTGLPVTRKRVVASVQNTANPANPAPDAVNVSPTPTNTGGVFMDFRTQYTTDGVTPLQGITVPNGWFFGGFRFNAPNARTDGVEQWTVNWGTSNRTITPGIGVIVTENVGTDDVVFTGSGWFRVDNTNRMILHQDNPNGDLIFRNTGGINARTPAAAHIVKSGRGRVIIENGIGANNGLYLHEGTVQIGAGGTVGALGTGPVINNGSLEMNRSDAVTFGGVISGPGNIAQTGSGVLTLSGVNTYSGVTTLTAGTLSLSSASAIGTSALTFNGGTLSYPTGGTTDFTLKDNGAGGTTARTVSVTSSGGSVNTNGNNVTLSGSIGGAGALNKTGAGTLILGGSNSYAGGSTVNAGTLLVTNTLGSGTGTGPVTVTNGSILGGTGVIAGTVTVSTGGKITPGVGGTGTLTVGGLSLANGSLLDLDFASTSSYDKVVVNGSGGLTLNGGNLVLTNTGNGSAWSTPGTYNLFEYSGALGGTGAAALSVLNPQAGYGYTFSAASGLVTLSIAQDSVITSWTSTGSGSWGSSGNWSNGVAISGSTAQFSGAIGAPATVSLDGNRTVNGLVFDSVQGYTVTQGTSGNLTLSKTSGVVAVNVLNGHHTISAPVVLSSSMGATTSAGTSLTISGAMSGSGGITKAGPGLLDLTAANNFSGDINVVGGVLGFTTPTGLGTGNITLNGGVLLYNPGNTRDISNKIVTFGLNGGGIDTGGNDVVYANPIGNAGAGAFAKLGDGSLTLSAGNTYTGATTVKGGELIISSNAALGNSATGAALIFDGGVLVPSSTFALDNAGSNARPVEIATGGGGVLVTSGVNLTIPGSITGSGAFTKTGVGTLTIPGNNSAYTGSVAISEGVVDLGANRPIGQTGLGSGSITLGGTAILELNGAGSTDNGTTFGVLANPLVIASGANASIYTPIRGGLSGAVTGNGTLNLHIDGNRFDVSGVWPAFAGTLKVRKTPTGDGTDVDEYRMSSAQNMPLAAVHINAGVVAQQTFNPPNSGTFTTDHVFGQLTADEGALLGGNPVGGRFNRYVLGDLNTNFTINGRFTGLKLETFGFGYPAILKRGTGTMTLNNSHLMTGPINVDAGTFCIMGAIERHYTAIGPDGIYGRNLTNPASPTNDDTISLTPPESGDYQNTEPGVLTVAAGATLAGNGKLGGAVIINGNLRPDATGSVGGNLTLTGAASLTLGATAVTQFDFGGANFTGVTSTAAGANTYGGALKFNFLGTVFNGSYKVFDLAVAPTGAFTGVSVTTTTATETALASSGTVWTGTVGAQSYSFDASTGVLTVTGGATAVTPGTSTLSATAGNAKIDLSWTSASGADTYTVKRALVSGGPYTNLIGNLAGTTYSDTTVTNGTTYYYVVQAKNSSSNLSGANSNEVSATPVAGPAHTALQTWRFEQFGVYDDTGAVLAGDTEDFDGDGLANLLEYALGTNPTVANANPVTVAKSGNFLTLTYPRRSPVDAALTYTVQASSDLAAGFAAGGGTTNTVGSTSTYTDNVSVSTAGTRRFLRLSVSYTAP